MNVQRLRPRSDILSLGFNQDALRFSCGLVDGFRVYTSEDFNENQSIGEIFRRHFEDGGIGLVEMLFRSNILALVGGGPFPKFPPNKVMFWDEHQGRCIGELPEFRNPVKAIKLRSDRIAVALEQKVFVYTLEDLKHSYSQETAPNPEGLLALSPSPDSAVLAIPGTNAGHVRIEFFETRRHKVIPAHESPLSALALSTNGKYVATASEKGTIIRVFSTIDGTKLKEFRRGSDPAVIYSLAFSKGDRPDWLAVTSDKGTLHIFSIFDTQHMSGGSGGSHSNSHHRHSHDSNSNTNNGVAVSSSNRSSGYSGSIGADRSSSGELASTTNNAVASSPGRSTLTALAALGKKLPVGSTYFTPERSFAQFNLQNGHPTVVAFGKSPNTILVASVTGYFYKLGFDPEKGGHCFVQNLGLCRNFVDVGNTNQNDV